MTGPQIVGAVIIALPFLGLGVFSYVAVGWKAASVMWAAIIGVVAVLILGALLLGGALP